MAINTFSSRQFNQDISGAKRAAHLGPLFVTHRGKAMYVLLTMEDYVTMSGRYRSNIAELLAMPEGDSVDFDPAPLKKSLYKPADFS